MADRGSALQDCGKFMFRRKPIKLFIEEGLALVCNYIDAKD